MLLTRRDARASEAADVLEVDGLSAGARPETAEPVDDRATAGRRARWRTWRRRRPLVGGALLILGGVELFGSSQLDFGRLHIHLGIEGLQALVIPLLLIALGALVIATPAHRMLYGIVALAVAVYSIVGVNLGGFLVGFLLAAVGGILTVSWMPRPDADAAALVPAAAARRDDAATGEGETAAPEDGEGR